jgi:hypothetical protein
MEQMTECLFCGKPCPSSAKACDECYAKPEIQEVLELDLLAELKELQRSPRPLGNSKRDILLERAREHVYGPRKKN